MKTIKITDDYGDLRTISLNDEKYEKVMYLQKEGYNINRLWYNIIKRGGKLMSNTVAWNDLQNSDLSNYKKGLRIITKKYEDMEKKDT
jgi:hypothetical protein